MQVFGTLSGCRAPCVNRDYGRRRLRFEPVMEVYGQQDFFGSLETVLFVRRLLFRFNAFFCPVRSFCCPKRE